MNSHANPAMPVHSEIERFGRAESAEPVIDRKGGKYGAGVIRGVSLASVGEALGHDMWLDEYTIQQVVEFTNAKGETGLKSRFTHPGMSSDGMGRHLGRIFNARVDGNKAIGDLHFQKSAHDTPDGDLAEYVMLLTEEDSRAAGLSIVFHHDFELADEFHSSNLSEEGSFESPDPLNEKNYPHVRIKELRASDIVDEPAANPDGLFDSSPLARQADKFLSYAAGISSEKPDASMFDIDSDRASQFFTRWLSQHGLSLTPIKEPTEMADNKSPETAPVTRESLLAEQKRYIEKFGTEKGVKWFHDEISYSDALEKHAELLQARISELESQLSEANSKIESISLGEKDPIDVGVTNDPSKSQKKTFASRIRVVGSVSKN